MTRINIGCGMSPTLGWVNHDNSKSLFLARLPGFATDALVLLGLVSQSTKNFVDFCRTHQIGFANAVKPLPYPDNSVEVIYASHMLEHFDRREADIFLAEALRILVPGGILRLAVPNVRFHVENYLRHKNADQFVSDLNMSRLKPTGLPQHLRHLIVGAREHHWMYDDASLPELLTNHRFANPVVMAAGETTIPDPGPLNLSERAPESLFVEARKT